MNDSIKFSGNMNSGIVYGSMSYLNSKIPEFNSRDTIPTGGGEAGAGVSVFLSHSHRDAIWAASFAQLLLNAFVGFSAKMIRCSSRSGLGLQVGNSIGISVSDDILGASLLVCLTSEFAGESAYVPQEIGAASVLGIPVIQITNGCKPLRGFQEGKIWVDGTDPGGYWRVLEAISEHILLPMESPSFLYGEVEECAKLSQGKDGGSVE